MMLSSRLTILITLQITPQIYLCSLKEMHYFQQEFLACHSVGISAATLQYSFSDVSFIFLGSYYLTTTYGALEHIKNYDKQAASRQLSLEIQDSIHRWERRRTLNKARASNSSIQVEYTDTFHQNHINVYEYSSLYIGSL